MAQHVQPISLGADVDSRFIEIAVYGAKTSERIENTPEAIRAWLARQSAATELALEVTGNYHCELLEQAYQAGVRVYLINPLWLRHYRQGVGHRTKSDRADARLLARYVAHEREELRPWTPPPAGQRALCSLLKRRAKLVQVQTTLEQSFAAEKTIAEAFARTRAELQRLARAIEHRIKALVREQGWWAHYRRCCSIYGVGEITAAALVAAFQRGPFKSADAFVAYLGLDVRRRQSGRYEGLAKLTKQGESEYRRLLHNAARAAARRDLKAYYEGLRARGFQPTQAHVAVARKLVRIAFSLMKHQTTYDPTQIRAAA